MWPHGLMAHMCGGWYKSTGSVSSPVASYLRRVVCLAAIHSLLHASLVFTMCEAAGIHSFLSSQLLATIHYCSLGTAA